MYVLAGKYNPVSEYVYGNNLVSRSDYDEKYAWSGRFTGTEYYTTDILGSVMLTTDSLGRVSNRYNYDAYGTNYTGSFSGKNKIGYNSKHYDTGTGWYNYGYRDYDSKLGRFTTQDPIRDGMNWYAYCGGDPINCIDAWGLEIDSSKLDRKEKKIYKKAVKELTKTERGKELVDNLKKDEETYTIIINNNGDNSYNPENKQINWNPNRTIISGDDGEISSTTLLAHEMGHAEQDLKGELLINPTVEQRIDIENQNIWNTENPIAEELGDGIRNNYFDWKYTTENGRLNQINELYYDTMNSDNLKGK